MILHSNDYFVYYCYSLQKIIVIVCAKYINSTQKVLKETFWVTNGRDEKGKKCPVCWYSYIIKVITVISCVIFLSSYIAS